MVEAAHLQQTQLARIAQVGVNLAGERYLPRLYQAIVREALALTHAEAGAVYMREGKEITPVALQIDDPSSADLYGEFGKTIVPLSRETLCGQAILQEKTFNLPDVHVFPEGQPAALFPEFNGVDAQKVRSLLVLLLKTPQSGLMGVLLLLNARTHAKAVIPFDPALEDLMNIVAAQSALAIQNLRWALELHQAYQDTLYRLSLAAEYREDPSGSHVRRISQYAALLASALGLPEEQVEHIRVASPMHDIGKISIPEAILLKPGKVTPEEFERIKMHTTLGALILGGSKTAVLQVAERIALSHHEKFDGSGYPHGQGGVEIPIEGRIVGLVDAFDALTTRRPYREAVSFEQAMAVLQKDSGTHFDPDGVRAFGRIQDTIRAILDNAVRSNTSQKKTAAISTPKESL
jgi:putative two-component system response regulator